MKNYKRTAVIVGMFVSACSTPAETAPSLDSQLLTGVDVSFSNQSELRFDQETVRGSAPIVTVVRDGSLHVARVGDNLLVDNVVINFEPIRLVANGLSVTFINLDIVLRRPTALAIAESSSDQTRAAGRAQLEAHFRIRWQDGVESDLQTVVVPESAMTAVLSRRADGQIRSELVIRQDTTDPVADWLGLIELSNLTLTLRSHNDSSVDQIP